MRVSILAFIAKLLGIQFKIYGLPFGASYDRSNRTLRNHPSLGKWGPRAPSASDRLLRGDAQSASTISVADFARIHTGQGPHGIG